MGDITDHVITMTVDNNKTEVINRNKKVHS